MEIWKDVPDYVGMYEVSNFGNVRAVARTIRMKNGVVRKHKMRILVPDIYSSNTTTYFRVTLSKDNKQRRFGIHQLVAKVFIPNPDSKPHVNHIDNNGQNNAVGNLEWCTHSENMLHAQTQGRLTASQQKGGQSIKAIKEATSKAKWEAVIGKEFGSWKVLHFSKKVNNRYYVTCLCTKCNETVRNQEVNRLLNNSVSNCCQKCASK